MGTRTNGAPALALAVGLAAAVLGSSARAGERARPGSDETVFALYCSGCHGAEARGGGRTESGSIGPDLTHLTPRFWQPGARLPLEPYLVFVTSPRRPGAQRICGERVFARLPPTRFREQAERWVVREALGYVASLQSAE